MWGVQWATQWTGLQALAAPPANITPPSVTGTPQVGAVLGCSTGTWSNSPTGYAYQWYSDGSPVGTNQNTYTPALSDLGNDIDCVVTARNGAGSGEATSNAVGPVVNLPPVNITLPAITGVFAIGQVVTCSQGTWANAPTGFGYQWLSGGVDVGADLNTYTIAVTDACRMIGCDVTATNSGGSAEVGATGGGSVPPLPIYPEPLYFSRGSTRRLVLIRGDGPKPV
jgi:hypothetical protein